MAPTLSEDEVEDFLYFSRTGDQKEFDTLLIELSKREKSSVIELIQAARDEGSGNGVLHMAAANGHATIISNICKLLSTPIPHSPAMLAILNAQNSAGNTALHWAALNGHLEAVKVLLDQGASPTITNQRGHDAVYEAELNDKTEVVEWVLKEGGEGLEEGVARETAEGDVESEETLVAEGSKKVQDTMAQLSINEVDTKS